MVVFNKESAGRMGNLLRQAPLLAEEVKIAGLLIRTFSPNFKIKLNFLLRCQIKRQNKTDPEEPYIVERRSLVKLLTSAIVVQTVSWFFSFPCWFESLHTFIKKIIYLCYIVLHCATLVLICQPVLVPWSSWFFNSN